MVLQHGIFYVQSLTLHPSLLPPPPPPPENPPPVPVTPPVPPMILPPPVPPVIPPPPDSYLFPRNTMVCLEVFQEVGDLLIREVAVFHLIPHGIQRPQMFIL